MILKTVQILTGLKTVQKLQVLKFDVDNLYNFLTVKNFDKIEDQTVKNLVWQSDKNAQNWNL